MTCTVTRIPEYLENLFGNSCINAGDYILTCTFTRIPKKGLFGNSCISAEDYIVTCIYTRIPEYHDFGIFHELLACLGILV